MTRETDGHEGGDRPGRLDEGFLSIDVESLVRKVAGQTFRSPNHYPVELVRIALARGARRVDLTMDRHSLTVTDDGRPIERSELERLHGVLDASLPVLERQKALGTFESDRGIGLLAVLAPSPGLVVIESGDGRSGHLATIERLVPRLDGRSMSLAGTRIRIHRRSADLRAEREAVASWCRFAGALVTVDKKTVSRHAAPAGAMAWRRSGTATVWIPSAGDLCRLWLLDHGVRWHESVRPPVNGLVFEASVDAGEDPARVWDEAGRIARALYEELARTHATSMGAARARIEELFFLHHRRTSAADVVDLIAPFAVLGGAAPMTFTNVREAAREGDLRAMRAGDDPGRFQTRGGLVLVLGPEQWTFLAEHAGVPLSFPPPVPSPGGWPRRAWRAVRRAAASVANALHASLVDPVDEPSLAPAMQALLAALRGRLGAGQVSIDGVDPATRPAILASRGNGQPGRLVTVDGRPVIVVYPDHPLVRAAARAHARDPRNLAVVLPMLTAGRGELCLHVANDPLT